jgi:Protein of unknown function (DUF3568)
MDSRPVFDARGTAFAVAMACLCCHSGCATFAPNVEHGNTFAGGYSGGRAVQDFPRDSVAVSLAVAESLEDLKMTNIKRSCDGTVVKLEAKTEDNRPVLVTIRPHQDQSRVGCRVGWFGDPPLSKAVLERIGIRLELLPPAPIPAIPPSSPAPNPFLLRDEASRENWIRNMVEAPYRDRSGPP